MALKDSRGGREYDKFVADSSGDTAMRVMTTTSATVEASSTGGIAGTNGGSTIEQEASEPNPENPGTTILGATSVEGASRVGLQFFNIGGGTTPTLTFKVWGSLVTGPGDPETAPAGGTMWTQIGDNITVGTAQPNAYKAISTTPIKSLAVTCTRDTSENSGDKAAVFLLAD